MIRINLLPHKKVKPLERGLLKLQAVVVALIVLVVAGIGFTYFSMNGKIAELGERKAETDIQLKAIKKKIKEVEDYEKRRLDLEQKLGVIKKLDEHKVPLTPYLNEVNRLTTKKVWLKDLSVSGKNININGMGMTNDEVTAFVDKMKASSLFTDIELKNTESAPSGKEGVTAFSFDIKGKLKVDEAADKPEQQPAGEPAKK